MFIALTVSERTRRVVAEDLDIRILGECHRPTPSSNASRPLRCTSSGRLIGCSWTIPSRPLPSNLPKSGAPPRSEAPGGAAQPHLLLFLRAALRHRDLRRALPGLEQRDPRTGARAHAELRRYRNLRLSVWLRGRGAAKSGHGPVRLSPTVVADIHHAGGTALGTSRGDQDPAEMADRLDDLGIGVLFVIGGDGTFRGAMTLVAEIERRGLPIAVIGIPKTIDNDIHFIDRSFGFETAFSAAVDVIRSAHVEATGAKNGIGVVKLMGGTPASSRVTRRWLRPMWTWCSFPRCHCVSKERAALLELLEARLDLESARAHRRCRRGWSEPLVERQ